VKDAQNGPVQGRVRWRRFAAVLLPAAVATGAIVFGMANGAIAAQFAVSGQQFKVSADLLTGDGFVQYGGVASEKGARQGDLTDPKNHAVATSGIAHADLTKLCQSVVVPGLPVSMVIHAGGDGTPAHADDLLIDMTDLKGDATFGNINIGQDASTLSRAGREGFFGQKSETVRIENLKQVALSTTAGTFRLTGLHLYVKVNDPKTGPEECF
jgi:hypothetical protein